MSSVWLGIDDVQSQPWVMKVATLLEDATMLSSGIAQETTHAARRVSSVHLGTDSDIHKQRVRCPWSSKKQDCVI